MKKMDSEDGEFFVKVRRYNYIFWKRRQG